MKFKVGDKVKVKSWEEMANTYGIDEDGDIIINGSCVFSKAMEIYCDNVYEVNKLLVGNCCFLTNCEEWYFTDEMLDKVHC